MGNATIHLYTIFDTQFSMTSLGVYQSSVTKSDKSCRTTIPISVAKALELEHKDKIEWEIMVDAKGRKFAIVTKGSEKGSHRRGAKKVKY